MNESYEYLPISLIKRIEVAIINNSEIRQFSTKNNFIKCIGIIYNSQINEYHDRFSYVAKGKAYWSSVFGGEYHKRVLKPLLDMNIIKSYDFGYRNTNTNNINESTGRKVGLVGIRYAINPLYTIGECEALYYLTKKQLKKNTISAIDDGNMITHSALTTLNVSIDRVKANEWIDTNAQRICESYYSSKYTEALPDNHVIEVKKHIRTGTYNTHYRSVKSAQNIAMENGMQLFYFKDTFYIADSNKFIKQRINHLKYAYRREISKVGILPVDDKISNTNGRLTNYLVNFPSKILPFIQLDNKAIVQIDLRTSQFLLLANIINVYITNGACKLLSYFNHIKSKEYLMRFISKMKEFDNIMPEVGVLINDSSSGKYTSSDVIHFIRDVFYNDFYVIVQKELGLSDRDVAKQLLFRLIFKKTARKDELLDKLNNRYPTLMKIIKAFKTIDKENKDCDNGETNLAVFLQWIESEIFIDKILNPLRKKGIPCFSRHDSICTTYDYQNEVEKHMKGVFDGIGFRYFHKSEELFWDVVDFEEMEESDFADWYGQEHEGEDWYLTT